MRGATLRVGTASARASVVSTHAPHARGDACESSDPPRTCGFNPRPSCEGRLSYDSNAENRPWFQPTPLMRGATRRRRRHDRPLPVSTHAPHARGDRASLGPPRTSGSFNPRPSCEGRRGGRRRRAATCRFHPTPLMRGATAPARKPSSSMFLFQPTPLMRGATLVRQLVQQAPWRFNPRPSCEGRLSRYLGFMRFLSKFQPTPLMRGATPRRSPP